MGGHDLLAALLGGKLSFGGIPPGAKLDPLFPQDLKDPHPGNPHARGDLLGRQPLRIEFEHLLAACPGSERRQDGLRLGLLVVLGVIFARVVNL